MKYDIAFLSVSIPREMNDSVRLKSKNRMEDAAIAWQDHIISGIEMTNRSTIKMINILPINAFPIGYKDAVIKNVSFSHTSGAHDVNVGFCNIKIVKRMLQWIPIFKEVDAWANRDCGMPKVLIAYTMYPEFMNAISHVKKKWSNIITINIVVDLPQFIVLGEEKLSFVEKIYQNWSKMQANKNLRYIDGFAVITKQMAQLIGKNKPCVVIEGISTQEFPNLKPKRDSYIRVIYAGLLHRKFGLIKLLDAFDKIKDPSFKLIICGIGETEEEIVSRAKKDRRITFRGQLPRERLLETMLECDIIVNPRENIGEYTKYSFPSKNLEALSSGIPFVGYKLDGIPDEYDKYINYPRDNSVEALAECLYSTGKTKRDKAVQKATLARNWVLTNKSPSYQGEKIIELIRAICIH